MAKLNDEDKVKILADFHTGVYSQRDLAMRYQVSHVTIGKITKGLEPKHAENVTALIAVKSQLKHESYQQVTAIDEVVTKKVGQMKMITDITELNLQGIKNAIQTATKDKTVNVGDGVQNVEPIRWDAKDYLDAQNMIHKAGQSLGVIDQFAKSSDINVNSTATTAIQTITRRIVE